MSYEASLIEAIAAKHGFVGAAVPMPEGGMVNDAWRIGEDKVLRIVKQEIDEECDLEAAREALVVPLAVSAGLHTPSLLAAGAATIEHRPYTIFELVKGELLGFSPTGPDSYSAAFAEIGRDLARLHDIEVDDDLRATLRCDRPDDWEFLLGECIGQAHVTPADAADIQSWQGELAAKSGATWRSTLCHNDVHAWNVIVHGDRLGAILDWGDSSWGDPAADFIGLPLQALPHMLAGYQAEGGQVTSELIARIFWRATTLMLWEALNLDPAQFGRHWWRMPPGGWLEVNALMRDLFPEFAP